jgi:hypothetical protein
VSGQVINEVTVLDSLYVIVAGGSFKTEIIAKEQGDLGLKDVTSSRFHHFVSVPQD